MHKIALNPDHEDERGTITDLVTEQFDSATVIYTAPGAVRGNHYHRETFQWTYVMEGELMVATRDLGQMLRRDKLRQGELMLSPLMEAHAWKALEPTAVLVLTRGPRSGKDYESDTIRLTGSSRLL